MVEGSRLVDSAVEITIRAVVCGEGMLVALELRNRAERIYGSGGNK